MHAETAEAAQWWGRPRGEQNTSWIGNYQNSLKNRHRDVIVSAVRSIPGTASILEVGSHCGPNLIRLAKEMPALTNLFGIDVNQEAVTAGNEWAARMGLDTRVRFKQGAIPEATSHFSDGFADVVLSCYVLAYISPKDIDDVLYEMGRLAKRAVILAEPMTETVSDQRMTLAGYREWSHNYRERSRWLGAWRSSTMTMLSVTPPVDRLAQVLVAVKQNTP